MTGSDLQQVGEWGAHSLEAWCVAFSRQQVSGGVHGQCKGRPCMLCVPVLNGHAVLTGHAVLWSLWSIVPVLRCNMD